MSKSIIEQELTKENIKELVDQYFLEKAQNNLIFDKEKVNEEFSYLCRSSTKENIEMFAKNFQLILDMDYQEGFFPIVATNHDNLEALEYFYKSHLDIYNKYYTNLVNAAAFNQSVNCQDFLTTHNETADIGLAGHHESHENVY